MESPRPATRPQHAHRSAAGTPTPPATARRTGADRFRPDLEGLRAVAVVLVLLYHAGVPGFGGGYIGVDVFFVLSGFLITGLILRELRDTGRVSLPAFYARRARRLLPAAVLTIAVTVAAAAILLPPLRMPDIAADGAAAALYASNLRFAAQATDYLASQLAPSPLLHFWSLGVEEQFYLFWPALLVLVAASRPGSLRRIGVAIGVVGIVSFALSAWLTDVSQPWAFFSLPARAWELALGGVLAVVAAAGFAPPRRAAVVAGAAGVVMIVLAGVVLDTGTPFPGTAALLPTVGAALVIAAGIRESAVGPGRLLSTRPFRYIGRISYSLYLWHWPIIVLPVAALGTDPGLPARVALALLAIPVAAASQRWVEEPIRHGRFVGLRPRRSLAFAGTLSLTVAILSVGTGRIAIGGLAAGVAAAPVVDPSFDPVPVASPSAAPTSGPIAAGSPSPDRRLAAAAASPTPLPATVEGPVPGDLQPSLLRARDDLPVIYSDGCHLAIPATVPGRCVFGDPTSSTTVVLFGDSHAAQWFPALERLARTQDWRLVSLTKSACPSAEVTVWNSNLDRVYSECDTWRAQALARIAAERPALVVVANSRLQQLVVDGRTVSSLVDESAWEAGLARTLATLRSSAGDVAVIGDTPRSAVDPPVCLSAHLADALACATPLDRATAPAHTAAERATALSEGAAFVDPTPWVCPSAPCPAVIGPYLVYRDQHHLTATFSSALWRALGDALPIDRRP